jgi:hypothetical protein
MGWLNSSLANRIRLARLFYVVLSSAWLFREKQGNVSSASLAPAETGLILLRAFCEFRDVA